MSGDIFQKERSIITLTSTGASLSNLTALVANATADLDCRASQNAADDMQAIFQLTCQWATVTGIVGGTVVADLFLVPLVDAANLPQLDLSAGASFIPYPYRAGVFVAAKAPTASTDTYFATAAVDLMPVLYRPYLLNRSGQTISANWTVKVVTTRLQYT